MNFDNILLVFSVVIGAYSLYAGIIGKGYAYKNDLPESIKPAADALLRKFLLMIGPLMLIMSAVDFFKPFGDMSIIVSGVLIGIVVVLLIVYVVLFRKHFGKLIK